MGIEECCARAASGHVNPPPMSVMNSRLRIGAPPDVGLDGPGPMTITQQTLRATGSPHHRIVRAGHGRADDVDRSRRDGVDTGLIARKARSASWRFPCTVDRPTA